MHIYSFVAEWTYRGETGPSMWARLGYTNCSGDNQSPVNIVRNTTVFLRDLTTLNFSSYSASLNSPVTISLTNTGHTGTFLLINNAYLQRFFLNLYESTNNKIYERSSTCKVIGIHVQTHRLPKASRC